VFGVCPDVDNNRAAEIGEECRDVHFEDLEGGWEQLHECSKAFLKSNRLEHAIIKTVFVEMTPLKKKKYSEFLVQEAHARGLASLASYIETLEPGLYLLIMERRYGPVSLLKGLVVDIPSLAGGLPEVLFSNEGGRFVNVGF
tara:strand:+ start:898 stop:1323 length:426 start_codon:yes stop_codon:yes gene_type:complete